MNKDTSYYAMQGTQYTYVDTMNYAWGSSLEFDVTQDLWDLILNEEGWFRVTIEESQK